jgi:hypothetical protein
VGKGRYHNINNINSDILDHLLEATSLKLASRDLPILGGCYHQKCFSWCRSKSSRVRQHMILHDHFFLLPIFKMQQARSLFMMLSTMQGMWAVSTPSFSHPFIEITKWGWACVHSGSINLEDRCACSGGVYVENDVYIRTKRRIERLFHYFHISSRQWSRLRRMG